MQTSSLHRLLHLGTGELLAIDAAPGQHVVVFDGKVWITQHDDLGDYVIGGGGSFACDRPGLMLIEALTPARFTLVGDAAPAHDAIGYEAAWPVTESPAPAQPARTPSPVPEAVGSYA